MYLRREQLLISTSTSLLLLAYLYWRIESWITKIRFSIIVSYFTPYESVQVNFLEFKDLFGVNYNIIISYAVDMLEKYNILPKIVAYCGINMNYNFDGSERRWKNNVFAKLDQITGKLIEIGSSRIYNVTVSYRLPAV